MEELDKSMEIAKLFKEVAYLFRQSLSKVGDVEHTGPQSMVIGILSRYGKMKVSDLSDKLGLSNSTVSGIIDRLEKQEIVERIRSAEDKRIVYISISPKFEEIHRNFHMKVEENFKNMLSQGSTEDLDKITSGLETLKRLLHNSQK